MTTFYFGGSWDAPLFEDPLNITEVETPIGKLCTYCEEEIAEGDRGFMDLTMRSTTVRAELPAVVSGFQRDDVPAVIGTFEPVHLECRFRSIRGSLADVQGRCDYPGALQRDQGVRGPLDQAGCPGGVGPGGETAATLTRR